MKFLAYFTVMVAAALAGQFREVQVNPALKFLRINPSANSRSSNDYNTSPAFRSTSTSNYVNPGVVAIRTASSADPVVYRAGSASSFSDSSASFLALRSNTATQGTNTPALRTSNNSNNDFITVNVVSNGPAGATAVSSSSISSTPVSSTSFISGNSRTVNAGTTGTAANTRNTGYSSGNSDPFPSNSNSYGSSSSVDPIPQPIISNSVADLPLPPSITLETFAPTYGYGPISETNIAAADFPFPAQQSDDTFTQIQPSGQINGIVGIAITDYPVFATIPATSFSCADQRDTYGYYADVEASCQVFHICQDNGFGRKIQQSFLCPNGTIFDQRTMVCNWWYNVNCEDSITSYSNNANFGVIPAVRTAPAIRTVPVPATPTVPNTVQTQTVTSYTIRATPELLEMLQRSGGNIYASDSLL